MAPSEAYASAGSGKLKLKGVKDSKVDKKKKKIQSSSKSKDAVSTAKQAGDEDGDFKDRSVMLKKLEDEDKAMAREDGRSMQKRKDEHRGGNDESHDDEAGKMVKTEAERRYEEQRRRRVCFSIHIHAKSNVAASSGHLPI